MQKEFKYKTFDTAADLTEFLNNSDTNVFEDDVKAITYNPDYHNYTLFYMGRKAEDGWRGAIHWGRQ